MTMTHRDSLIFARFYVNSSKAEVFFVYLNKYLFLISEQVVPNDKSSLFVYIALYTLM